MAKKVNKTLALIQVEAKKLWADKEKNKLKKYSDAIKKASDNLKKLGKI
jgi:hypothetical protein